MDTTETIANIDRFGVWTTRPGDEVPELRYVPMEEFRRISKENDSLHLELNACQHTRRKDNEYLLDRAQEAERERDELVERYGGTLD